jgi:hypothetical protein
MSDKDDPVPDSVDGHALLSRRRTLQGVTSVIGATVIGCRDDAPIGGETGTGDGETGDGDGDGDPGDGMAVLYLLAGTAT